MTTVPAPAGLLATEDDFLAALQARLPRGRAWPRDPDANLTLLLRGIAKGAAEVRAREVNLLVDAFPSTTYELLPDWEETLGLPDPCLGATPTIEERRGQIVARLTNAGGQSVPFFVGYAAALGFTVTIDEYRPRRFGDLFGTLYGGDAWAYYWQVNAPTFTVHERQFGDAFGGYYADWGSTAMQCEFQRLSPGHTTVGFVYS